MELNLGSGTCGNESAVFVDGFGNKSMLIILFVVYLILQGLDFVSSVLALRKSGTREGDPIAAFFIRKLGTSVGLVVAKGIAVAAGCAVFFFGLHAGKPPEVVFGILDCLYLYVAVHNFAV